MVIPACYAELRYFTGISRFQREEIGGAFLPWGVALRALRQATIFHPFGVVAASLINLDCHRTPNRKRDYIAHAKYIVRLTYDLY